MLLVTPTKADDPASYNQAVQDVITHLTALRDDLQQMFDQYNRRLAYTLSERERFTKQSLQDRVQLLTGQVNQLTELLQ